MAPAIAVQKGDANSVLAPAPKHPDFLDLCIALTGRVPLAGPFLDAERRASLVPLSPQGQEIGGQQGVAIAATHAALDPQEL